MGPWLQPQGGHAGIDSPRDAECHSLPEGHLLSVTKDDQNIYDGC